MQGPPSVAVVERSRNDHSKKDEPPVPERSRREGINSSFDTVKILLTELWDQYS
jgi:hypothetical protein